MSIVSIFCEILRQVFFISHSNLKTQPITDLENKQFIKTKLNSDKSFFRSAKNLLPASSLRNEAKHGPHQSPIKIYELYSTYKIVPCLMTPCANPGKEDLIKGSSKCVSSPILHYFDADLRRLFYIPYWQIADFCARSFLLARTCISFVTLLWKDHRFFWV